MNAKVPLTDFQPAKKWVTECEASHEKCPTKAAAVELPARLVQTPPLAKPKTACLRPTKSQIGSCATLSHCWGGGQPFQTTEANLNAYAQSLPYNILPKTIRDALEVVQNLGLESVWIDSLCIIQEGDDSDKKRELATMMRVYQNAKVTISAASASSCRQGFLEEDYRPLKLYRLPVRVDENTSGTLPFDDGEGLVEDRSAISSMPQPVNTRA